MSLLIAFLWCLVWMGWFVLYKFFRRNFLFLMLFNSIEMQWLEFFAIERVVMGLKLHGPVFRATWSSHTSTYLADHTYQSWSMVFLSLLLKLALSLAPVCQFTIPNATLSLSTAMSRTPYKRKIYVWKFCWNKAKNWS